MKIASIARSRHARWLGALVPLCLSLSSAGCAVESQGPDSETIGQSSSELSTSDWAPVKFNEAVRYSDRGVSVGSAGGTTVMVRVWASKLYWAALGPNGWPGTIPIPGQVSAQKPSLAAFNGYLYMVHLGNTDATSVYVSRLDLATQTWSTNYRIPYLSKHTPAIQEFNGRLYMVGTSPSDNKLWMASMNTSEVLSPQTVMNGHYSAWRVSLTGHNGRLYMAHRAGSTDTVVTNSFDGASWGWDEVVPAADANAAIVGAEPVIASLDGYLHLIHQRPGDQSIWWTYFDGVRWSPEVTLGTSFSSTPPSLTAGGTGLVLGGTMLTALSSDGPTRHHLMYTQYKSPVGRLWPRDRGVGFDFTP